MPLRYIPALIIVLALAGASIYFYQVESSYVDGMEVASGEVVGLGSGSTSSVTTNRDKTTSNTQAIVDFEVNQSTFTVKGRAMGMPAWKVGESVEVYYSKANPEIARIKRWDELYFFTLICAFFLIASLVFAAINFAVYKVRGRPLS
ncbi:MAG: DUF3592 domain-containing protein [Pseudomonadota bacterium]